jgi:cytochrome c553
MPGIRYDRTGKRTELLPGALGAHSWQSIAFNPMTGLVYIPAQEIPMSYESVKDFKPDPVGWNVATATTNLPNVKGYLIAWDPVRQKEAWRANYLGPWNGGILTSAGNLVVQGNAAGDISAYRADSGEKLWSMFAQSPVIAAPITYEVKGEQYIAVLSGWGGAYPLLQGQQSAKSGNARNVSRLLVFKLGAKVDLPALPPEPKLVIDPPADTASPATVAAGEGLYGQYCTVCHGEAVVAGGITPDLRGSPFIAVDAWYSVVLGGALKEGGMAPFASVLDRTKAAAIRAYVIHRANEETTARSSSSQHRADADQGAVIVAQGTASGAPACAACHAFTGGSDGSGAFPRIAGQPAFYLSRQLRDFSSGVRSNSIMSPIARALSSDNIEDLAAYYANATAQFPPLAKADPQLIKRGKELAEAGNSVKGIPGCGACHGAEGAGESPTIPYLAGQYAHYTALQLQMWQRGFRANSPTTMRLFANKLDGQEIAALAAYYQQLQAPSPSLAESKR